MVGDSKPVYHCKFALLSNHECDYCICNNCYENKRQDEKKKRETKTSRSSRVSRMKRKRNVMYDDEDDSSNKKVEITSLKTKKTVRKCTNFDHEVAKLNVCCDAGYFTREYVQKKLKEKDGDYPISCNECGKQYTN